MKAYIVSSKAISAQQTFEDRFPLNEIKPTARFMPAIEPDYKQHINPLKLRRMSRVVKMGVAAAMQCLKQNGSEKPGSIITATGWGCLSETFKFLDEIGDKHEQTLSPSTFIQSTHNTVGGQIALMLECQEYNSVYVNDSTSFEHGLLDALLLLEEGKKSVLLGGIDELTDTDAKLKEEAGWWKSEIDTSPLYESTTPGTCAGEGSVFFLLGRHAGAESHSCIGGVKLTRERNPSDALRDILSTNNLSAGDIDLVISGINGDSRTNMDYRNFLDTHFNSTRQTYYKHLTGEYDSASAFALWLADKIIRSQEIPELLKMNKTQAADLPVNHILIHHFKKPSEHAFILVSKTGL